MELKTSYLEKVGELPCIVEPMCSGNATLEQLLDQIAVEQNWVNQTLLEKGGVLFRGFRIQETEEFQRVAQALIPELKPYVEGQSPRTKVTGNVYTSTEFPAQFRITLHNELSYTKAPPPRIVFHCHIAPETGGETPIVDCRKLYQSMPPATLARFEERGVRYVKNMHGQERGIGKSWMDYFETSDQDQVESYLKENDIEFEWTDDGNLRTWSIRPATIPHPVTGEMLWFNQADLWHITNVNERNRAQMLQRFGEENLPTHAYFGDGSPITDEDLEAVRNTLWENAVIFPWQQGDVLALDNFSVAHGRMPYEGPRKILVAMG
ncbi:peptide synthase [Gimesia fumaroli]|uniref:Peptide synthase n=2 Tax=Gimesia fumaroli TaxID=2527976 RepID=A0A518IJ62_9PLAN|nr:peptide synthase [Gimesia fumaroli]